MKRYMLATKATHLIGDVSREEPDLCLIQSEDADSYIGHWVTGFALLDVHFPKATTRPLTPEEKERWQGTQIMYPHGITKTINLELE